MAVIITKADLLGFDAELGLAGSKGGGPGDDWSRLGAEGSPRIEAWLRQHEPHLVEVLRARFGQLRFFAVSSLGHLPEPGRAFAPWGVLEPLGWLLASRTTFAKPGTAKLVTRTKEIAAAATVVGAFIVVALALVLGGASLLSKP